MLYDITLEITPDMIHTAGNNESKALSGHIGTHFDVMDRTFPLEYTRLNGVVFDCRSIRKRVIEMSDVDMEKVKKGMAVLFCTDFIERVPYGERAYFREHPELSFALIDALLDKGVAIIGIDFCGIRRGKEHTPQDQRAADRGCFVVENLCNLSSLVGKKKVMVNTYPLKVRGITGIPARVIAEADESGKEET